MGRAVGTARRFGDQARPLVQEKWCGFWPERGLPRDLGAPRRMPHTFACSSARSPSIANKNTSCPRGNPLLLAPLTLGRQRRRAARGDTSQQVGRPPATPRRVHSGYKYTERAVSNLSPVVLGIWWHEQTLSGRAKRANKQDDLPHAALLPAFCTSFERLFSQPLRHSFRADRIVQGVWRWGHVRMSSGLLLDGIYVGLQYITLLRRSPRVGKCLTLTFVSNRVSIKWV